MNDTSPMGKLRAEAQSQLTATQIRYDNARGDEALVLGGRVLALEGILRTIDTMEGNNK